MRSLVITVVTAILFGLGVRYYNQSGSESAPTINAETKAAEPAQPLAIFAGRVVTQCRATGTEARLSILTRQITKVAEETFSKREHQEAFMMMVCIESKFDNSLRSKVGAVGYTQLMPALIPQFAVDCGLGKMVAADAQDGETNLRLGACVFRQLLEKFDGNVALALSGYNSGPDSPTTKKLGRLVPGHQETMGYIATFYQLKEEMK